MRRVVLLACSAALAGCFGYPRPSQRNREYIGAPAETVAGFGLYPSYEGEPAPEPPEARRGPVRTPALARLAVVGTLRGRSADAITVERPLGDELRIQVDADTLVLVDDRPGRLEEIPRGASVRTSYQYVAGTPRAVEIEAPGS